MADEKQDALIAHIDTQLNRLYNPLYEKLRELRHDVYGDGQDGMKTRVAVMDKELESFRAYIKDELDDIKEKIDRAYWFSLTTMVGVAISIVLFLVFP